MPPEDGDLRPGCRVPQPRRFVCRGCDDARPDREAVHQFAKRYPDRWAQAVAILARLGGYHDKLEIDTNVTLNLSRLSDMELMQRLSETDEKLAALEAEKPGSVVPIRKLPSPK